MDQRGTPLQLFLLLYISTDYSSVTVMIGLIGEAYVNLKASPEENIGQKSYKQTNKQISLDTFQN